MYDERVDGLRGYSDGSGASETTQAGSRLHVSPDNVLAARDAIRAAVDEAHDKLRNEIAKFETRACAQDPVSVDAEPAWNHRLVFAADSHANRIHEYIDGLYALVDKLTATAQTYGLAEQSNTDTFRGTGA